MYHKILLSLIILSFFTTSSIAIDANGNNENKKTEKQADSIPSVGEITITNLDFENDNKDQNISGILHSGSDIFLNKTSFNLSAAYFRNRGYSSNNNLVFINNMPVNDGETGYPVWSEWGGLNEALRNKDVAYGSEPTDFTFGDVGSSINMITRASLYRKYHKFSYALSNKSYTNRIMYTYATGLLENGWAFTFSGSRRWGQEGYITGTYYDAWGYFFATEKRLGNKNAINLTVLGSPTKRGMQGGSTQEVYDLLNNPYYNPNWGYQNGKVRNAKNRFLHEPKIILNHYLTFNERTKITTTAGISMGHTSTTSLNWYDAADPRPDYYRYLPSYQTDQYIKEKLTNSWQQDPSVSQLNWDRFYQINLNAALQGNQSKYMLEERRVDQFVFNINSVLKMNVSENILVTGGINFNQQNSNHYKTVYDLLGGEYWVDIDQFAERDFPGDEDKLQNDINNPDRIVKEGDRFGYDYNIVVTEGSVWGNSEFSYNKLGFYTSGRLAHNSFYRIGNMKNGRYPDNSFGKSDIQTFINPQGKIGINYKFNGRNIIYTNGTYMSRAPYPSYTMLSERIKNEFNSQMNAEIIFSGDINYVLSYPKIKAKLSLFHTTFNDFSELNSFYHDEYRTFVNHMMYNIDKVHQGVELGTEYKLSQTINLFAVASIGEYIYTNRPDAIVSVENGSIEDFRETIYIKNFFVPGGPQKAGSAGFKYAHPKYWYIESSFNYFYDIYLDFNPERRTELALENLLPNDPVIQDIINQYRGKDSYTIDLSIGKSFKIDSYFIYFNLSVNNILNNQSLVTGGYEQMRFDYEEKNVDKFPAKLFYAYGRTFFATTGIRF